MTSKVLATGHTHTTPGKDGGSQSRDGWLNVSMANPHPAAENLFGAAWSACYLGALQLAAAQKKVTLPETPSVDAELSLNQGDDGFFLTARLDVSVPGVDRALAEELVEAADQICPYSKAVRGNIDAVVRLA